jgi:ABC-type lipoprotein export system ATPase subunit
MTDLLVEGTELWRSFRRERAVVAAVQGCSFRVHTGDTIAIVGPSGSGKTTLLNLIAGLDTPSAGRIVWQARGPVGRLRPERIGMVFQSPSLLPALTSIENVALPILLAGGADAEARAATALAAFGVEHLAGKLPEQLSGGQAERIAVARAVVIEPQLVLADEPAGQLDHANGLLLIDRLLAWLKRSAGALVVATHDEHIAARMGRVWRINHGHLDADARGA